MKLLYANVLYGTNHYLPAAFNPKQVTGIKRSLTDDRGIIITGSELWTTSTRYSDLVERFEDALGAEAEV